MVRRVDGVTLLTSVNGFSTIPTIFSFLISDMTDSAHRPHGAPAFTLVELIVVITILAVLATVGFLALQGYTKDAKNSTLKTNVRTIARAVELGSSPDSRSQRIFATHSGSLAMSGKILGLTLSGADFWVANTNYTVGKVNFSSLWLDPAKFASDGADQYLSVVDVSETLVNGRVRPRSFFQAAALLDGVSYVEGTFSPSLSGSTSDPATETTIGGLIRDLNAGTNAPLVSNIDSNAVVVTPAVCNSWENGSTGVCKDPNFASVTSLLHFNDGYLDALPANTWTPNGNITLTGSAKWGSGAVTLDGAGDYVDTPDSANWDLGTGDFTIEWWFKTRSTGNRFLAGQITSAGSGPWYMECYPVSNVMRAYINGNVISVAGCTVNTWHHFALVRSGTVFTLYLNGVPSNTYSSVSPLTDSTSRIALGRAGEYVSGTVDGFLDEFRVTKGVARYSANFSSNLPTQAFASN